MAIEDNRHLQLFDDIAKQLEHAVIFFNECCNGVTDRETLLRLRREQNEILAEAVVRHKRALDHLEGKPVEPKVQFAESVLVGAGGGATF